MNKKDLSETDIRTKFITPAIAGAGWDLHTQIREEVALTAGKVIVRGKAHKRGHGHSVDQGNAQHGCWRGNAWRCYHAG